MHVIELSLQVVPESGVGVQPIIVVVSRNKSGADEDGKRDASASPVWGGQDFVSAHLWFNLASVSATGQSQESAVTGRDMTYGEMTPAQRAEGQRLAREWDEAHPREPEPPSPLYR